jgi:hypothetical protein
MLYLKSVLIGVLAALGAALLTLVGFVIVMTHGMPHQPGTAVGVDPVSIARSFPQLWLFPAIAFAGGFAWEYRRLRRPKSDPAY